MTSTTHKSETCKGHKNPKKFKSSCMNCIKSNETWDNISGAIVGILGTRAPTGHAHNVQVFDFISNNLN